MSKSFAPQTVVVGVEAIRIRACHVVRDSRLRVSGSIAAPPSAVIVRRSEGEAWAIARRAPTTTTATAASSVGGRWMHMGSDET